MHVTEDFCNNKQCSGGYVVTISDHLDAREQKIATSEIEHTKPKFYTHAACTPKIPTTHLSSTELATLSELVCMPIAQVHHHHHLQLHAMNYSDALLPSNHEINRRLLF